VRMTAAGAVVGLIAVAVGLVVRFGGGEAEARVYDRGTPEAALAAAFEMIEAGDAGRLSGLIHAESEAMRGALDRFGRLCKELQDVAAAAGEVFPEEAAGLRSVMREDPAALLSAIGPRGGSIDPTAGPGRESLRALMADPYGWLISRRERLGVVQIDDERAAVQYDGRPVFGLGLMMRKGEDGAWRVELPLRFPGASRFVPQNEDEWAILGSMIDVLSGALDELEDDLRAGRARDLSDAARMAGEKALGPIVLCTMAYQRALEARGEE